MSLAESPAVDRMLQRVFPGASLDTPVLGVDGNTVSVDPRGDGGSMTADMGSMFQALMPIAQQVKQPAIPPPSFYQVPYDCCRTLVHKHHYRITSYLKLPTRGTQREVWRSGIRPGWVQRKERGPQISIEG